MSGTLTNAEKISRLPWSVASGAANSVSAQWTFFGPPFVLLLSELGVSNAQVGFLFSLFPFTGLLALVLAPSAARFGNKRTYLTFWAIRYVFAAGLLLLPWLQPRVTPERLTGYIAVLVLAFAVCRAIAETGYYPWQQEFVPDAIRGKYYAAYYGFSTVASFVAVLMASYVVGRGSGLGRYMGLIAGGVVFGGLTVWLAARLPGGTPQSGSQRATGRPGAAQALRIALGDARFRIYLLAAALVVLGSAPLATFQPLLLQNRIGLPSGLIVLVQAGVLLGGFGAGFLWGWMADRFGSKPVIMSTLVINVIVPLGWAFVPRDSVWTMPASLLVAFLVGAAANGWLVASGRLLYGHVIPHSQRTSYTSLHYAWMGVVGGIGPLLAGALLDSTLIHGQIGFVTVDPYLVFLLLSAALSLAALQIFHRVEGDSDISFRRFLGMFLRGNPLLALESSLRYTRTVDEAAGVSLTERLGQAHSPLNVDELLAALEDPRYVMRMEAVISMARSGPDARCTAALVRTLTDSSGELPVTAAWALGRLGDLEAAGALRAALAADDPRLRSQSARALGYLGDEEAVPLMLAGLRRTSERYERQAYAAALGNLRAVAAVPDLLVLLRKTQEPQPATELALALARIVSGKPAGEPADGYFIPLWRAMREDPGTGLAQAVLALRRRLHGLPAEQGVLPDILTTCAESFAAGDLAGGAMHLAAVLDAVPMERLPNPMATVLCECRERLAAYAAERSEYLLMTLCILDAGLAAMAAALGAKEQPA
jgi:MFS family permease